MGCSKYRYLCPLYFFAVGVLHLMISSHKEPTRLVAKSDDLRVFHVRSRLTVFVFEPIMESLNGEASGS